jgi:hypothetical protein
MYLSKPFEELNTNPENKDGSQGDMTYVFQRLVGALTDERGGRAAIAPSELHATVRQWMPKYGDFHQHDACLCMKTMRSLLVEDLNSIREKPYFPYPPNARDLGAQVAAR